MMTVFGRAHVDDARPVTEQRSITGKRMGGATMTVPEVFDQPGAAFVFLREGAKFPPLEKGWENHPHTYDESARPHTSRQRRCSGR